MKAIILAIGDELLNGQTQDTNSSFIARKLAKIGVKVVRVFTVPDETEAIKEHLKEAFKLAHVVVSTGGLGPTKDDKTKDAICEYFGVHLKRHSAVEENLHHILRDKPNALALNANQSFIPENATPFINKKGTAPGIKIEDNGNYLYVLPGVPYEMSHLIEDYVVPDLQNIVTDAKIDYRFVMVYNVPESVISYEIAEFEEQLPEGVSLSYLPDLNLVKLRLSFYNCSLQEVEQVYTELVNSLNPNYFYTLGDVELAGQLGQALLNNDATLGLAESCTGGYLSHLVTQTPGCSAYYKGGLVSYAYKVKSTLLNVSQAQMLEDGAVSEETVLQMAAEVNKLLGATCGIAISGIAGPEGGTEDKPVGTVWIATNFNGEIKAKKYVFPGDRNQVIKRSARNGMIQLMKMIRSKRNS